MRVLIGASVISAAGSLPLQILPFLVLSLVSEGRVDIAYAGWVGSAYLIGMLTSGVLLPLFKVSRLTRWHALIAISAIILSLTLSIGGNLFLPLLLVLWFVVGFACGALQFLGATTAAAATNKPQAFALRLAIVLVVASAVIVALALFGGQSSYSTFAYFLIGAFGLAACIGLTLYRTIAAPQPATSGNANAVSTRRSWSGLAVVFAFFAGQPGFWAYAMQSASQRNLDLRDAAFVIAASKIISALVLVYSSRQNTQTSGLRGLIGLGCAVAMGILVMTYSSAVAAFFVGFLLWELALNVLSARLQGIVVAASPGHAGVWITGAILLGAATGPIVHGAAIGGGIASAFIAYAALSGLFPFFWAWSRNTPAKLPSP
ncbi:hypothetical protein [Polaromonas aquatica]|uniref:hypothetical protein n=1 Tax=Polaromonas aquatica TaxID=332657 RepID=UPI003D658BDF